MAPPSAVEWTPVDVQAWLLQQGVGTATTEVIHAFKSNDIDGSTLLELTAADIREELKISNLGVRKKLLAAIEALHHREENKQLQISTSSQRKIISDDIEQMSTASTDYMVAVQVWDTELKSLESTINDAEYSAQVHNIELGNQRCIDANVAAAEQLAKVIETAVSRERADASVAHEISSKRDERSIQQVLSRAQDAADSSGLLALSCEAPLTEAQLGSSLGSKPTETARATASSSSSSSQHFTSQQATPSSLDRSRGIVLDMSAIDSSSATQALEANSTSGGPSVNTATSAVATKKKVECVSCREKLYHTETFPCGHIMCHSCIGKLFMNAANDLSLWPVRCCKQRIDISLAGTVLSAADMKIFVDRVEEAQAVDKMYCTNPYCSQFINIGAIPPGTSQYSCPKCDTLLCLVCRTKWHPNISCEQWGLQQKDKAISSDLMELAKREGWRPCGRCGVMVQLAHGCNHMTCRCSHQFCYICGLPWYKDNGKERSCGCDLWSERNLVVEENRRVQLVQRVERRVVAPAERVAIRAQIQEEECAHDGNFRELPYRHHSVNEECSNCGFFMAHYAYRCSLCRDLVCYTCRHHRL